MMTMKSSLNCDCNSKLFRCILQTLNKVAGTHNEETDTSSEHKAADDVSSGGQRAKCHCK